MYRNTIYRKETLQGKVYSELLRNIVTGKFPPGTPLPSRTELENEFNAGKETIKKVLKKLAENGYIHPRCRRSALVAKKLPSHHYTIAMPVCVADSLNEFDYLDSPWGYLIFNSVSVALLQKGHTMLVLDGKANNGMLPSQIDGVVMLGDDQFNYSGNYPDLPILMINPQQKRALGALTCDFSEAFTKVAVYFLSVGVKHVLLLGFNAPKRELLLDYAQNNFVGTLLEQGFDSNNILYGPAECCYERADAEIAVSEFLSAAPQGPVCVLASGDMLAQGAVDAAKKFQRCIKKDFFAVGCTGLKEVEKWDVPISTAGTPFEKLGQRAAEMIIDYIASGNAPEAEYVKSQFIKRNS